MFMILPTSIQEVKGKLKRAKWAVDTDEANGKSLLDENTTTHLDDQLASLERVDLLTMNTETLWRRLNKTRIEDLTSLQGTIRNFRQALILQIRQEALPTYVLDAFHVTSLPKTTAADVWMTLANNIQKTAASLADITLPENLSPNPNTIAEALTKAEASDIAAYEVHRELKELREARRKEVTFSIRTLRLVARRLRDALFGREESVVRTILRGYGYLFEGDPDPDKEQDNPDEPDTPDNPGGDLNEEETEETTQPTTNEGGPQ